MGDYVRVQLGRESYAVPVAAVRAVADAEHLAPVPGAHTAVLGVRNFHGQVVPVIDLGALLGITRDHHGERVVIAEADGSLAGLSVDAITGVQAIAATPGEVDSPHLGGAALIDGTLVGVLDVPAIFDHLEGGDSR